MESDYPDGLPPVMSSSTGRYSNGAQGAPFVTGYEGQESLFQPFFLQQSMCETADGTNDRHNPQYGMMLQDASHTSVHNSPRGFQSLPSLHERTSMWAMPADVADDFDSCSSRASSNPCALSPAINNRTIQYTSRQTWPPVDDLQETSWMQSSRMPQDYVRPRRPLSAAVASLSLSPTRAMSDAPALDFSDGGYRSSTSHPNYTSPLCDGLPSSLFLSPQSTSLVPDDSTLSRDNTAPISEHGDDRDTSAAAKRPATSSRASRASRSGSKEPEPYAQLIYRAFMSHPRHAMTLQEIYQWFRENTDKPHQPDARKGWQNSIRHNLSMNQAFQKQDKKLDEGIEGEQTAQNSASGDNKKSSEWYLLDWAVKDGVQSTTRYRKGNSTRRVGTGRQTSHGHSARRSAGRHGGVVASRTKESHRRRQMVQEAQMASTSVPASLGLDLSDGGGAFGAFAVSMDQNRYAHRGGLEQAPFGAVDTRALQNTPTVKSEDEPMMPITPEADDLLVLPGSQRSYSYEAPRPRLAHSAYTYDDVTGMYTSSSSSSSRMPPLFADPEDIPDSLRLLSEYPSAACAWTNSDMGSSEFNF